MKRGRVEVIEGSLTENLPAAESYLLAADPVPEARTLGMGLRGEKGTIHK